MKFKYLTVILIFCFVAEYSTDYTGKTTKETGKSTNPSIHNLILETILPDGQIRLTSINGDRRGWTKEEPIGYLKPKSRIVGGRVANPNEAPYQIAMRTSGFMPWCGAAIYNKYWLITAAHCVFNTEEGLKEFKGDSMVAGAFDMSRVEATQQVRSVASVIIHEEYFPVGSGAPSLYDIALISLTKPFVYTDSVQPIRISPWNAAYPRGKGIVSGWGYTRVRKSGEARDRDGFTSRLKVTNLTLVPRSECQQTYRRSPGLLEYVDDPSTICAGEVKGGADACQGDSGGPLVCSDRKGKKYLCGVVSTGIGCGLPNYPGIYTRVSKFAGWIIEHAGFGDAPTTPY